MKDSVRWIGLAMFIIVCLGAGGLGAVATTPEIEGWYTTIDKPTWNPPDYIFGPVWTTLFVMMAVAAWLVWKPEGFKAAAMPLGLFAVQLVFNVAWSWIFFEMVAVQSVRSIAGEVFCGTSFVRTWIAEKVGSVQHTAAVSRPAAEAAGSRFPVGACFWRSDEPRARSSLLPAAASL